jgi:predicted MFS family arabinose efflux permease
MSEDKLPPAFTRLAWSNLSAQSAEQIGLAAAPIVAVVVLGAGPGETGFLQTMQTLPFLLMAFPAGMLADRVRRGRLMARAEALRAAALIAICAMVVFGGLSISGLAILGFIGATGTVTYSVTAPALIPSLVHYAGLPRANGRLELARSMAFTAGPGLGGILVGWIGPGPAFGLASLLSVTAVLFLSGINDPPREPAPRRHILREVADGASFGFSNKLLRPILITSAMYNVGWFMLQAVYVPYAVHELGLDASGVGMVLAGYGVGMILGALTASRIIRHIRYGTMIMIGPWGAAVAVLLMLLTFWIRSPLLFGFAFFVTGSTSVCWIVSSTTLRQAVTPLSMLGRVSATITTMGFGSRPVGAALGGIIGSAWGVHAALLAAAFMFIAQMIWVWLSPPARLVTRPEQVGG